MKWALLVLLLSGCAPGIVKMGLRLKVDIFGAKVDFKLPIEVYPVVDGGFPPSDLVCE